MKTKHTPGPWKQSGTAITQHDSLRPTGCYCDVIIASMPNQYEPNHHIWPEVMSNARLIAAAPCLLEALIMAQKLLYKAGYDPTGTAQMQIDSAINKATGEA